MRSKLHAVCSIFCTLWIAAASLNFICTSSWAQSQPMPTTKATKPPVLPATQSSNLTQAQISNLQAQTAYYQAQTNKPKSLEDMIKENLGAVAAFVAAMIAFISFVGNRKTTLKTQRDTQFYEALKRFGDKDSPTVRCSAAGLLAQISADKDGLWWRKRHPYLTTAFDQLNVGLLLEDNPIVLFAIQNAIIQIVSLDNDNVIAKLYETNLLLQRAMVIAWADFNASEVASPAGRSDIAFPRIASGTTVTLGTTSRHKSRCFAQ